MVTFRTVAPDVPGSKPAGTSILIDEIKPNFRAKMSQNGSKRGFSVKIDQKHFFGENLGVLAKINQNWVFPSKSNQNLLFKSKSTKPTFFGQNPVFLAKMNQTPFFGQS